MGTRLKLADLGIDVTKMRICYQCCFCKEEIEKDITAVVLVLNWDKDEEKHLRQQFFCHRKCFEKTTKERIEVDVEDPTEH